MKKLKSFLTGFPAPTGPELRRQTIINGKPRFVSHTVIVPPMRINDSFTLIKLTTDDMCHADYSFQHVVAQQQVDREIREVLCR